MSLFLLTFSRASGQATVEQIDSADVIDRLFEAESRLCDHPQLEIVLLTAADEDDLRRTHSRYFESIDELLEIA